MMNAIGSILIKVSFRASQCLGWKNTLGSISRLISRSERRLSKFLFVTAKYKKPLLHKEGSGAETCQND